MTDRILWNRRPTDDRDPGDIDEIVLSNVHVHIEQMGDREWWIGMFRHDADDNETGWYGNFVADSRGRMRFVEQENDGITWDEDRSHEEAP